MSKARIYARNLAANWIGHGANLVVMFFLSPFIVHTLGKTEYGIWSLLTVLTGYMGIFDLGIRAGTGRYIILYLGKGDHRRLDETLRTGLGFFSALAVLLVSVGIGLGWAFPHFFEEVPESYHGLVKILLPVLAINMWLAAIGTIFDSVLRAHDRFEISQVANFGMLALRAGGTVYALYAGYGIVGLAAVTVGTHAFGAVVRWALARRIYRPLRIWPLTLSKARLRELFGFGIAAFLGSISYKLIHQTDEIVVGAAISVSAVTIYAIGHMLVGYSWGFIQHISGTVFPRIQRAAAQGELDEVRWLYLRQARLGLMFGLPLYLGFIFFGRQFITLWMGPEFADSYIVLAILSTSRVLYLFLMGMGPALAALGFVRVNVVIGLSEAAANLGLSLLFAVALGWGIAGVAVGTLVALLLVRTSTHPLVTCHRLGLGPTIYLRRVVLSGFLALGATAAVYFVAANLVRVTSWPGFFLQVAVAGIGGLGASAAILLLPDDGKRIWGRIRHCAKLEGSQHAAEDTARTPRPHRDGIESSESGAAEP